MWYGNLLQWRRASDTSGWYARHAGRMVQIVKVTRRDADERDISPGWHLAQHPDNGDDPDAPIGPPLAATLTPARTIAEVWAISMPDDRRKTPSLITTMQGGGTVFSARSGALLVAYPDATNARITVRSDSEPFQHGPLVGVITPSFTLPSDPDGVRPVHIQWHPSFLVDGDMSLPTTSWHAAVHMLGDGL